MEIETVEDLIAELYVRAAALRGLANEVMQGQVCEPGWERVAADRVPMFLAMESEFLATVSNQVSRLAGVRVEAVTVQLDPDCLEAANQDQFLDPE